MKLKILFLIFVALSLFSLSYAHAEEVCSPDKSEIGECVINSSEKNNLTNSSGNDEGICIPYFYGEGCPKCAEVEPFIKKIEKKYSDKIHVRWLELYHNKTNYQLFNEYCIESKLPVERRGIPFVVVGDNFLMGAQQIKGNLEEEILKLDKPPGFCPLKGMMSCHPAHYNPTEISPAKKIKVSLPLVVISGLIDGVNPCAFAVLIFLLAYLTNIAKSKKRMLGVGSTYIIMVYITYFIAGLGFIHVAQFSGFTGILYKVAALIAILAGLINIKEYFLYGKGISLKIPQSRVGTIKKWARKMTIPSAIVLGFLVAMFELPCTGGIYLAILAMMANSMTMVRAAYYLLLYNLMFIFPLIIIFSIAYFGVGSRQLERWRKGKEKTMRLLMGLLLLGLGIIMLYPI